MSLEWKTKKLGDCCSFQEGYVNPSQKFPEYFDGDIKWIRAVDLNDGYVWDTTRTLTKEGFESAGKSALLFKPNTIVISKSGTVGRLGIIKDYMCGNRATINIIPNNDVSMKFIFYILKYYQKHFENMAVGSVQKNLYVSILENLEIKIPSLEIQEKISNILSYIDDKIENLNKINKNLERIIHSLFIKYFYQNLPYPHYNNSFKGKWKIIKLKELVIRNRNKIKNFDDWKDELLIDLSNMPRFSIALTNFDTGDKFKSNIYKLEKFDLLFGSIRPYFGKVGFSPIDGVVTGTVHSFKPIEDFYFSLILSLISSKDFINYTVSVSKGTKMPSVKWEDFIDYEFAVPEDLDYIKKYNDLIFPLIVKIDRNIQEIQELTKLRDSLLPRLMSGEIDVSKINCDLD